MKFKSVNTFAALLCSTILLFAAPLTASAQNGVKTAEFELNPPAEAFGAASMPAGIFHFSFATGKTEWVPFGKPANIQELAELAMRAQNPEKAPAGLDFSIRGEIDMRKAQIVILSEDEIKSLLSTGKLPEKKPTTKAQGMKPDSWYLLKDETDRSTYVFRLKDHSPGYIWQQIAYVRIPDGTSWKKNPDLTALLNLPQAIDGLKTIPVSGGVPNLAEGKVKEVEVVQKDLKAYYPAAAKAGDFTFFSQGKSPLYPNGTPFKKEMLNAGCDYFDGVDAYPGEGDTLLLSLNKRCAAIPDDKVESLCKDPAKLVGDYYGVPMDITAAEQPMVLLETSAKKLFLIVGLDTASTKGKITYLEIPRGGISKEQANAIREYRTLQKKKMNADMTMRRKIQESNRKEAERKQAEEQARQDAMNKRIEDVKQQSGDTFPKTPEEISLAEELILGAEYDRLLELCKGKKLDFNVNGTRGNKSPLLYQAIEHDPERRNQDFLDRKNKIFEFVLNNGGAAVISTEGGVACVGEAAATNNKFAFDLLVKDGFDFNRKLKIGMTIQEYLLKYRNIAKIDAEIMKKINSESRLSLYMRLPSIDAADLKKELEDKENPVDVNKPDGSGMTLLDYAIDPKQYCSPAIVSTLLDAGAKFKESTVRQISSSNERYYFLPLFWQHRDQLTEDAWYDCFRSSITARNIEAFKFFLEQGFDPDKKTNNPYIHSPLMVLYEDGTQEMVEMMEARGYKKPFWAAVKWNDLDLAKEYLDAGVDVNEPDNVTRKKPISLAVSAGNLKMAELLIEHGVKVSPDDYRRPGDYYPVASAATSGQTKMVELLLKHGFVTDFPETPGDTKHPRQSSALYIALLHGHYETAKLLLKYGARTDVTAEKTVFDLKQGKSVKIDAGLKEIFKNDPEALKVLGAEQKQEKGFFDF